VPVIITSCGRRAEVVTAVHRYGGIVLHDVISIRHAEKALEAGRRRSSWSAPGRAAMPGTLSPLALSQRSGASMTAPYPVGRDLDRRAVLAAQAIAPTSPNGTPLHRDARGQCPRGDKAMLVGARPRTIVYTCHLGRARQLPAAEPRCRGLDPGQLPEADSTRWISARPQAFPRLARHLGSGQGLGSITDVPDVADCVARLRSE